jgi:2-oxoglutarate ferredoxin oxidoreductase subunit alpha
LTSITKKIEGTDIMRNMTVIGAALALMNAELEEIKKIIKENFEKKGAKIVDTNLKAVQGGYDFVKQQQSLEPFGFVLEKQSLNNKNSLINGNDALCLGALKAGLNFAAIYPMTPVTSVLEFLASQEKNFNIVVKEPEDEISAINMAIGAGFAGARALTATSGGGFCLMTEGLGFAGMAEIPLVIIEGMRGGPSTGLPTKTEQGDLMFILNAGHGEFPKVVIAPGDPAECYKMAFEAFNIAVKYQLPVIILTDKYLASSQMVIDLPDDKDWQIYQENEYKKSEKKFDRFTINQIGVSQRSIPGDPGAIHHSTSYEHDEAGREIEDPKIRNAMMEKRMKKLDVLAGELHEPVLYGHEEAELTFFGWGSTKGPILEAMKILELEGIEVNFLHLTHLLPFPSFTVATLFDRAKNTLIVENNYGGQMAEYISQKTGRRINNRFLKYDGRAFAGDEIAEFAKNLLSSELIDERDAVKNVKA